MVTKKACLLATLSLVAVAVAGEAQQHREGPAEFKVTTALVTVDLVARDNKGRPVVDLKPEEIQVREDKQDRPVRSFELQPGSKASDVEKLRAEIDTRIAALPPGSATNLTELRNAPVKLAPTVLLIDGLNTEFVDRASARREMLKTLSTLDPRQPIAVYALGGELLLLQDFTTDPQLLRDAVQRLGMGKAAGGVDDGRLLIDHTGSDSLPPNFPLRMYQFIRSAEFEGSATQLDLRVQKTLGALNEIARRLTRIPGRKSVIWLSSSFPFTLMPDDEDAAKNSPFGRSFRQQVIATVAAMNAARIAIYPVDASGVQPDVTTRVDMIDNRSTRRSRVGWNNAINETESAARTQRMEGVNTMNVLADGTGGRAFYNHNDVGEAVAAAIEDGAVSYLLTFAPAKPEGDGKLHRLKISTTRNGVDLLYRRGYVAVAPASSNKERERLLRATLHNALLDRESRATGVMLWAMPSDAADKLDLVVDGNSLTVQQGLQGQLRVNFAVEAVTFGANGALLKNTAEALLREFSSDDLPAMLTEGITYRATKAPAATMVRFGVCDLVSGRMGIVTLPLEASAK